MIDLEEHKRLEERATKGPWWVAEPPSFQPEIRASAKSPLRPEGKPVALTSPVEEGREDAALIVIMRNDHPALIAELEQLRARVKELEERNYCWHCKVQLVPGPFHCESCPPRGECDDEECEADGCVSEPDPSPTETPRERWQRIKQGREAKADSEFEEWLSIARDILDNWKT
jgi:hypothetical protein